jgi:hypothetical protein
MSSSHFLVPKRDMVSVLLENRCRITASVITFIALISTSQKQNSFYIKEDEMSRECNTNWKKRNTYRILMGKPKERDHWKDQVERPRSR